MIALSTARIVALQFACSNPNAIPAAVKRQGGRETRRIEHKKHSGIKHSGIMIIEPTEKCSLAEFPGELEKTGRELVNVLYEKREEHISLQGSHAKRYHMARFLFAHREFVELSREFEGVQDAMRAALSEMCIVMWRVRAFSNPFYYQHEEIPGQRAISINLEARQPLLHPNGGPVTIWQRDENGNRVGDAPLPLKANYCLRVVDDAIQLVTA